MKKNLRVLSYLLIFNFILVIFTLTYWQVVRKDELFAHPRNKRLYAMEAKTLRGQILDSKGRAMALTEKTEAGYVRKYPYKDAAVHLTGYNSVKMGKTGLEYHANAYLLGITGQEEFSAFLPDIEKEREGFHVTTTVDMDLQLLAYRLLGDRKGAIVALEPKTGRILAMVSKPSFNPEEIEKAWSVLQQDEEGSPLLNRATQGLYPPGSTLKVVTGAGALRVNPENWTRVFDAPGEIVVNGNRIADKQVKGRVSFLEAMQRSSNFVFATLGLELGPGGFYDTLGEFGLTERIGFELGGAKPIVPIPAQLIPEALAETAIGQGKLLITPLHMALVASIVANDGQLVEPYLLERVNDYKEALLFQRPKPTPRRMIESDINQKIVETMKAVVKNGTGRRAALPDVIVAGKTGSAENPHGPTHAWFIGFAPAEEPEIAVAVILENSGTGGEIAAPIAREIIRSAIKDKR